MTVMALAAHLRNLSPDHLQAGQAATVAAGVRFEFRARNRRAARVAGPCFRVTEVDQPVAGELRMQDHVTEAALPAIGHRRHAAYFADLAGADIDQAQATLLLGDQQASIGQESHRPRLVETRDLGALERWVEQAPRRCVTTRRPWPRRSLDTGGLLCGNFLCGRGRLCAEEFRDGSVADFLGCTFPAFGGRGTLAGGQQQDSAGGQVEEGLHGADSHRGA